MSLVLFAISLPVPAFEFTFDGPETATGWMALTWVPSHFFAQFRNWDGNEPWMGWTSYLYFHLRLLLYWSPNFLFLLGFIFALAYRPGATAMTAAIGFLVAAWVGGIGHPLFVGYYLWLASLALLAAGGIWAKWNALRIERESE